ncbi:MAG: SDR family NAD(P)-dependent oxidoreductase [Neisseria sp.]
MNVRDCAILGLGYLGRPLAERLYQNGCAVAAIKHQLTSDDINLPINLEAADLNLQTLDELSCWPQWQNKPVWICLLPPSALSDYVGVIDSWLQRAREYGVEQVIYSSSTGVYGEAERICDEFSELAPASASTEKVCAAEQLFINSGIPNVDILRFGGLYSAQRHPLNSLLKRQNIAGAHQPVNMIHQDRAVSALVYAAQQAAGIRIRNIVENRHPPKHIFYAQEALKLGLPEADFNKNDQRSGKTIISAFHDFDTICAVD